MKLIKKLIFCVAFISCSVYAQFFPYTDITIDIQDENRQFSVDREYYGTTPFYEFTITDNGSAVDLSGWDFALKYGYDKNADVLYTFTGSDYISVTNNKVLVNGTTNYWFEPHNDYYIALEGTYLNGNYKYIFAEGSMNVTYSPASDEDVNNILNGLTFTLLRITDFVAYTNYINSTVRPEDLGTMAYVSTNDYATISITNNIVALEAGTNTWNSAVQPEDLNSASNYLHGTTIGYAQQLGFSITPKIISTIPVYPLEAYTYVTGPNAGSMVIEVDGVSTTTLGIDLAAATNYEHVAALLQDRLDFLIPTITITYSETGPAWTMDIGDTNATHIDEVRGYALSGIDDIAWLFGWSQTNNPVVVDGVGYITTAVQQEDLGSAAFAETNDFVSSSVNNLTAWNTAAGGVVVHNAPTYASGHLSAYKYQSALGDAVLVENFDNADLTGRELKNDVDGSLPYASRIDSIVSGGKFGYAKRDTFGDPLTYLYKSSWGTWNQTTSFTMSAWIKDSMSYALDWAKVLSIVPDDGTRLFELYKPKQGKLQFRYNGLGTIETPIAANVWYYVTISYDPQSRTFFYFLDGNLLGTHVSSDNWTFTEGISTTNAKVDISRGTYDNGYFWIDDFVLILNGLPITASFNPPTTAYGSGVPETINISPINLTTTEIIESVNLSATALQTNDVGSAAFAAVEDFAAATLTNNVSALEAGTNTWNSAVQPGDTKLAGATSVGAYDSISIGFSADAAVGGTSLGSKTETGISGVAVGMQAVAPDRYGVAIGYDSSALEEGIAIGKNAYATTNAIQLGEGNNTFPGTLQIYDSPFFDFVSGELYPNVFDTFANALGSAAWSDSTDFATAAEGDLAITAVQPGAADLAYASRNGSKPMTGDLDMDGYDIVDAGVILGDIVEVEQAASSSMDNQLMALRMSHTAKSGYYGTTDDWVGASGGVGFYCVDVDDAADFSLNYISTNNYIKVSSPSLGSTPLIARITGYGECVSTNSPVVGLLPGDRYVLFNYASDVSRTNDAVYSKFGSRIATATPDTGGAYKSGVMLMIDYLFSTPAAGNRAGRFAVYLTWATDLTTPTQLSFRRCIVAPSPTSETYDDNFMSEINWLKNELIFFAQSLYQKSDDNNRVEPARLNITAVITADYATVTAN